METTLMDFVLNPAAAVLAHVAEHFAEHPFKCIVAHHTAGLTGSLHGLIAIVSYIEGGAIHVTTILSGITVMATQTLHIFFRPHNTCNNNLMERYALGLEAIKERATYIL